MNAPQEYKHTDDMGEISGFGGDYEAACQQMLHQGVTWLLAHPEADPKFHGYRDVYGLVEDDNEDAKALSKAVCENIPGGGPTGAMHHAVISRLMFIKGKGWEGYCEECRKGEESESTSGGDDGVAVT